LSPGAGRSRLQSPAVKLRALSILCVVLLAALAVLWVRSYSSGDQIGYVARGDGTSERRRVSVALLSGRIAASEEYVPGLPPSDHGFYRSKRNPRPGYAMDRRVAGFEYRRVNARGGWLREFRVPMYAIALVLLIPPAALLARARRRKRDASLGVCPHCRYDLRHSTSTCPECGASIVPAKPLTSPAPPAR
jgi:hypothetical protein